MGRDEDSAYYRRRAEQERARAAACRQPAVARVHQDLADAYERQVARLDAAREA